MIIFQLFLSFFQIGLFSIGGGFAALPLIQNQVVDIHQWLTLSEFTDLITISNMTPGPIAINAATFVGTRLAGLPGAILSTLGCIFPSCVISLILAHFYYKYKNLSFIQGVLSGLRPAVIALIASAGCSLFSVGFFGGAAPALASANFIFLLLFCICFFILRKWKLNPIWIMLSSGAVGGILYLLF